MFPDDTVRYRHIPIRTSGDSHGQLQRILSNLEDLARASERLIVAASIERHSPRLRM